MNDSRSRRILIAVLAALLLLTAAFGCSGKAAAPELANGDFETSGGALPQGWFEDIYDKTSGGAVSEADAQRGSVVHITAPSDNDVRLCQTIKVRPDTAYTVSCFVKTSGVEGGAGANIGVLGVPVSSAGVYGDSDWQRVELTGRTVPGQTELTLSVGVGSHGAVSKGEAWFDGVEIALAENAETAVQLGKAASSNASGNAEGFSTFPTETVLTWSAIGASVLLLLWLLHYVFANKPFKQSKGSGAAAVILILLAALAVRLVIAYFITGHKTDIKCFTAWGVRVAEAGPSAFYDQWCDYPPGYMLVLGLMAKIGKLFKVSDYSLLVKIPAMIADLVSAYLVYAYAKRRMSRGAALTLMSLVAFTPVLAYISSGWGQIDQVLALLLVVPILLLYDRKPIFAGLVYGAAIIVKPQALMAGPLFAAAYIIYVAAGSPYKSFAPNKGLSRLTGAKNDSAGHRFLETVVAVLCAVAILVVVSLLFRGGQPWYWLAEKYYGTATSYDYATVNAYNFWALIGANWKPTSTPFMGLDYGKWGTIFMAVTVLLSIAAYVFAVLRHKNCKGALPLVMAFMFSAIFTFGHFMHERYVLPVLLLLAFAYVFYNDRRILWSYVAYGITVFVNCLAAFYYSELFDVYKQGGYADRTIIFNESIIFWCSAASMISFMLLTFVTFDLVIRNKPRRGYNG